MDAWRRPMTDTGNFDAAPIDPAHGSSGPGGPLPGPENPKDSGIKNPKDSGNSEQPETRTDRSDVVHPKWCDPKFCSVTADRDRWHESRPVTVRGSEQSDLTIVVQLYAWPDGRNTYVNIAVSLVDMEGVTTTDEWPVPAADALALGHVLVSLARRAVTE